MYHYSIAPNGTPDLQEKLKLCRALGVTNLEIPDQIDHVSFCDLNDEALENTRQQLIFSGVRIAVVSMVEIYQEDASIRRFFRAAHRLHVENILLPQPSGDNLADYIDACRVIARYARSYGIGLLVTNFPKGCLRTDTDVTTVVHALDEAQCGTVFDVCAYLRGGIAPFFGACYYSHGKGNIRMIRIGDLDRDHKDVPLNHGLCNMREVVSFYLSRSFDGYFSLKQEKPMVLSQWETLLKDTKKMLTEL